MWYIGAVADDMTVVSGFVAIILKSVFLMRREGWNERK